MGKKIYLKIRIYTYAAAAKSLQSCPALCDPIDGSPPGSPIPGILQARTLEWVAISFSNAWKWKVKVKSLCRVRLLETPCPSMGFFQARVLEWGAIAFSNTHMQKVLIFRLHRYEYKENKYKDTNVIVHKPQCYWISCQRHKHKHATLQMHPLTCIFLSSFSLLPFHSILYSACKCVLMINQYINTLLDGFTCQSTRVLRWIYYILEVVKWKHLNR